MEDRFGRKIEYLRLSVTDRCNLRCRYCMPEEGAPWMDRTAILRYEELTRLVRILVSLGVRRVRLTGGEPLVRPALDTLAAQLRTIEGLEALLLTTNGTLFLSQAEALRCSGVSGVNFSVDTLRPDRFRRITRRDAFVSPEVLIDAALSLGFSPVRVNCVTLRGFNDDETAAIAALARHRDVDVRFIEWMPMGCGTESLSVPMDETAEQLRAAFGAPEPLGTDPGGGPANYVSFPGFLGRVGFIAPMSHCFCRSCNRLRLSANGVLRLCLQAEEGLDLRTPLREGASDEELAALIRQAVREKPAHHTFRTAPPCGLMHAIGG